MSRVWWMSLLMIAGCALQQHPAADPAAWQQADRAELHGRCYSAWVDRGVKAPQADAVCSCLVSQFEKRFTHAWLVDGKPLTDAESELIGGFFRSCAQEVVSAAPAAREDEPVSDAMAL